MARILLISTYELGHQPLHLASPAAALGEAGHQVRCLDLAVDGLDLEALSAVDGAAFSVPMHTAMRLAVPVAQRLRTERPGLPVAFYGLYAAVGIDRTVGRLADRVIAGEYQPGLLRWAGELDGTPAADPAVLLDVSPGRFGVPDRSGLPPLERYARLAIGGELRLAGYVEASHGCRHRCAHCPIPAVYDGRFRIIQPDIVVEDIAQLVAMGAEHITFGDPDFLNGPAHALRVIREAHAAFPGVTWDLTVKVEHILAHAGSWAELASLGVLFVVSAFETVDDHVLGLLDKGHTSADLAPATSLLRSHRIEVRPSWLPFTPWTTPQSLGRLVALLDELELWGSLDPIQLTIRLLVPDGSLVLGIPDAQVHLSGYHPDELGYRWQSAHPEMDVLQQRLAALVEAAVAGGEPAPETLGRLRAELLGVVGVTAQSSPPPGSGTGRPRLTEAWFCCAEPSSAQLTSTLALRG